MMSIFGREPRKGVIVITDGFYRKMEVEKCADFAGLGEGNPPLTHG
jgi:hypothetical protein